MTEDQINEILEKIVRREGRSLLQYVHDAFPWTTPEERSAMVQVQRLVAEECQATGGLMRFLQRRRHTVSCLSSYPAEYTDVNYTALEHLLPVLREIARKAVARLELDLAAVAGTEAHEQVEKILAMKRRHLESLEGLVTAHPQTMSTVR